MANGQKQDGSIVTAEIADGAVTTPKIANGAVTYEKMQNVSATDRLLGRVSASSGVVEEIVLDTDGTLAANSDDRVPTQKAIKTYVDAAVGGGGPTAMIPLGSGLTGTFTTSATQVFNASGNGAPWHSITACPLTGNYAVKMSLGFTNVSGSGGTPIITLKTNASNAVKKITSASAISTLIAANTTLGTYAKGSTLLVGDGGRIVSGSSYALTAGDTLSMDTGQVMFTLTCSGLTSAAAAGGVWMEKV